MTYKQHHGSSMRRETMLSRVELREQFGRDHQRLGWVKLMAASAAGTHLVWPRELHVGPSPVGRVLFLPGKDFRAMNVALEEKFMTGKTQRLWAWRVLYRGAFNALVYDLLLQVDVREVGGVVLGLQVEAERRGLEWVS